MVALGYIQKVGIMINTCLLCKQVFSNKNVYSAAGWKETQISGLCEKCFDGWLRPLNEDEQAFLEEEHKSVCVDGECDYGNKEVENE